MTWLAGGLLALLISRPLRPMRRSWKIELLAAASVAMLAGMAATVFDFGGWLELDWRAVAFAFLSALAAIALSRLALARRSG